MEDLRPATVPVMQSFQLTDYNLIYTRSRCQPLQYNELVRNEIYEMLAVEIITPSQSDWSFPVITAGKKEVKALF